MPQTAQRGMDTVGIVLWLLMVLDIYAAASEATSGDWEDRPYHNEAYTASLLCPAGCRCSASPPNYKSVWSNPFNPLAFEALKYFCRNHGNARFFFKFEIIMNVSSQLLPIHFNTYIMGLQPLEIVYTFSAGIDFEGHNLTSSDVNF